MNVVIVTHGRLAEGFASAVEVLLGNSADIYPVCVGETAEPDVAACIADALDACDGPAVIVTDALAGSTTQLAAPIAVARGVPLVTGANLGLVMGLAMAEEYDPVLVDEARDQVVLLG